jgi:hypothetical protein
MYNFRGVEIIQMLKIGYEYVFRSVHIVTMTFK